MLLRYAAVVLAALFIAVGARADEFPVPKQSIVGADKAYPLGDLVQLSVSPVGGDKPATLLSTSEVWKVYDLTVEKGQIALVEKPFFEGQDLSGQRYVLFGAGIRPKTMFVSVAITHLYVVKDEATGHVKRVATKTIILTATVKIGEGPAPEPEPKPPEPTPPSPQPEPEPSLPEGRFALAKFVYDQVKTAKPANARDVARKHATAYRGIVSAVAAGAIRDPRTLLVETQKAVSGLGGSDPGWAKVADKVQERLFELYSKERKLNSVQDFSDALTELTVGLEAVR